VDFLEVFKDLVAFATDWHEVFLVIVLSFMFADVFLTISVLGIAGPYADDLGTPDLDFEPDAKLTFSDKAIQRYGYKAWIGVSVVQAVFGFCVALYYPTMAVFISILKVIDYARAAHEFLRPD
jgi:hypothetical protein